MIYFFYPIFEWHLVKPCEHARQEDMNETSFSPFLVTNALALNMFHSTTTTENILPLRKMSKWTSFQPNSLELFRRRRISFVLFIHVYVFCSILHSEGTKILTNTRYVRCEFACHQTVGVVQLFSIHWILYARVLFKFWIIIKCTVPLCSIII